MERHYQYLKGLFRILQLSKIRQFNSSWDIHNLEFVKKNLEKAFKIFEAD